LGTRPPRIPANAVRCFFWHFTQTTWRIGLLNGSCFLHTVQERLIRGFCVPIWSSAPERPGLGTAGELEPPGEKPGFVDDQLATTGFEHNARESVGLSVTQRPFDALRTHQVRVPFDKLMLVEQLSRGRNRWKLGRLALF
jgi:hypothetical protein